MIFDRSLYQVANGFLMPGALIGIKQVPALILIKLQGAVNQRRGWHTGPEGFIKQFKAAELITNSIAIFYKQSLAGHPGSAAAHRANSVHALRQSLFFNNRKHFTGNALASGRFMVHGNALNKHVIFC
ncbi:hypothetical protein DSECCO2_454440 [anaerobic digester metagenome]